MSTKRAEIQGLRALAVASVVLFHIWPNAVPGGYVGVDVFFVISGYLITGLLFEELNSTGKISLSQFYARRIRRLLPAATLVLLAIALAMPLLPKSRWEDTALEIAASALYVENWRLAWLAIDYLGAENVASPVQHYWSLSIEEQFYAVWPIVMIAGAAAFAAFASLRTSLLVPLAAIALTSLASSLVLTALDQQEAYFVTHTRVWELALGGLLSLVVLPVLSPIARELMRLIGLAAIVVACFAFTRETPFPGYAALLPALGSTLVIVAGKNGQRLSSYRLLASPPAQYLGDISYSMYLWHWPLIVFTLAMGDGMLSIGESVLVAGGSILLAAVSKRFVEDPFRKPGDHRWRTLGFGGASTAACVAVAGLVIVTIGAQRSVPAVAAPTAEMIYPGPAALLSGPPTPDTEYIPPLALIRKDTPEGYKSGCHLGVKDVALSPCTFGRIDAVVRLVLVGDSHAAQWIPAFEELASTRGWRVETHTKSGCPLLIEPVVLRGKAYKACREWGRRLLGYIAETAPDIVVFSQSAGVHLFDEKVGLVDALAQTWQEITRAGVPLVVIADTPRHEVDPAECLEKNPNCASSRTSAVRPDPMRNALKLMPDVSLVDMTDYLCTKEACPIVIGNIVVWRDDHHLTATYSRMLASALGEQIERSLNQ